MATARSKEAICSLVKDGTLKLERKKKAARDPNYTGLATSADTLMVVERNAMNLQLYSRHDGKLLATLDTPESIPWDVCLISNTEVCVILNNSKIVILSFKSIDDVKRVKTLDLTTVFDSCHAVAKVQSMDKVVVSGDKQGMTCWCVVSLTDEHVDTIHTSCKGGFRSHLATKNNTVYISCPSYDFTVRGVYAYDIFNPPTQKFLYQHRELFRPCGLTVDTRGCIFVCYLYSNSIHQLTDRGELVTIHRVSPEPYEIFYEDQHGVLYTTSWGSNEITRYRLEYLHQPGIPIEILNMDDRSIQLFEEALKDGKETVCSIRVMVVGHFGVGKTTLIKRLLGEEVNINERHSTEGIDVYVNCSDVSLSTREWTRRIKDSEQDYRLQRLARVLNEQQSARNKVADNKEVVILPQEEKPDSNASVTDKEQVVIQKKDIEVLYRRSPQQDLGQVLSSTVSNASVTDKEQVVIQKKDIEVIYRHSPQQDLGQVLSSTVSNASVTDKEQVVIQKKDIEVIYRRSPQQDLGQVLSSTVSQQTESTSTLVHQKLTQSETNTMAMLKSLQENAYKLAQDAGKNSPLTVWDFAGQYAFYTTHQTFLTRRAIYLLVSDVSEQLTDLVADECYFDSEGIMKCKVHEMIEVWLNSIHACAPSPKAGIPPVILVGTHVDKILQGKHHDICKRYFREIRSYLKDKPTRFHLVDEDFAIDNTVIDRKLEDLKRKVVEVASQQPYWGEEIPARWLPLEQELMRKKAAAVKVISREDVESINKEGTVRIEKSEELDLFLRFLHETGTIIYFSIEVLRDNIVLDPIWLIDALKSLINAQPDLRKCSVYNDTQSDSPADSDAVNTVAHKWSDFKDKGILTLELIDAIWTKEKYPELHANKDHILLIMEQLNIFAKQRALSEIGEKVENYFLTPCMLRQESPRDVISPKQDTQMVSTAVLCCVFTGKFLPPPIFHRLLAACIARWPVAKKKQTSENLIFCGCCVFDLDLFHRLTLHCRNHIIFARITRIVMDEVKTSDAKLCTRVRKFITLNLSRITSYLSQNVQYELRIQCPPSQDVSEGGMVGFSPPFQMWFADEGHDPDAPITPEHMNHARLYFAVVTVCGNALREILLSHVPAPHTNIYKAVLANKSKLTSKRQVRPGQWQNAILIQDQSQVVFPDPFDRYMAAIDQFDISLLYTLIRNVSTVPGPLMVNWGIDPIDQPTRDKSLGASVERIRSYRNHISGHSSDGKMSQQDFDDYWNKIDTVLGDIDEAFGRQVYRAQLERQKRHVISIYEAV